MIKNSRKSEIALWSLDSHASLFFDLLASSQGPRLRGSRGSEVPGISAGPYVAYNSGSDGARIALEVYEAQLHRLRHSLGLVDFCVA